MTIPRDEFGRMIDTMPMPPKWTRPRRAEKEPTVRAARRAHVCGLCGNPGHNAVTCALAKRPRP